MRTIARLLSSIVALLLLFAGAASADERILQFNSDLQVASDGAFTVTETIRVNAEGNQIRRGIFRDFPIVFTENGGRERKVDFRVVSVTRNGQAEPYAVERASRVVRVRIGDANVFLTRGVHEYAITYETDRQIRRFETHDEVFWNATGTEWNFPIDRARATIRLPDGANAVDTVFFTGRFGATGKDARVVSGANSGTIVFETTRPLGPREGLTVGVKFPKGIISEPDATTSLMWFLRDFTGEIIAFGGLFGIAWYYLSAWSRVGRDPPEEVVVPRWDLPEGVTPALTHYIHNKGLKQSGFPAIASTILNLAVKGHVDLKNENGVMTLTAVDGGPARPSVGERVLLDRLAGRSSLTIDKKNGKTVQAMASDFRSALEKEHRSVFYRSNAGWIIGGVVMSIIVFAAAVLFGNFTTDSLALLIPGLFAGTILTTIFVAVAKNAANSGLAGKMQLLFFLFIAGSFVVNLGAHGVTGFVNSLLSPWLLGALVTLFMLNVLFFFLMGAPTPIGQKRSAEIEGLKRYLTVAEEDRMNMLGSPEMSPQHYETLLPFAVALGVEKPWSRAFQKWLAAAVAAGAAAAVAYHGPRWYHGDREFSVDRMGDSLGNIAGDLSKSMTASLPAPERSSSGFSGGGGGGGFSGGGGGGGGGGGW